MWFVYFIESKTKQFLYIGATNDLQRRIEQHNSGNVQSTKLYRPFELIGYIALPTAIQARTLESYLKTGSGRAILKKRILQLRVNH